MALTLWPWRKPSPPVIDARGVALAERSNGRTNAPLAGVSAPGVVHFNSILWENDFERAWNGDEKPRTILRMLNSPNIGAALQMVEMFIRRVDWTLTPADDSPAAKDVADFVQECFDQMQGQWPGENLARISTYLGWGWSCHEIVYRQRDDGRIGWDEWRLIPQSTRYGWNFDDRGKASDLIQLDPMTFKQITVPLDRCIVIRYGSRDNSPEGASPLRVAYDAWYFKSKLQIIEGIGAERDVAGLPLGRVPSRDIEGNTEAYRAMQEIVTGVRVDSMGGVVLASDRDESGNFQQEFGLVSTAGTRALDIDKMIRRYANEELMVLLANVMRTGQDGTGSFALSDTQAGLFQQGIGAHLDTIADAINEQAIKKLIAYNPWIDPELTPTLTHGDIESADLERLGKYITDLATAGLLEDTAELRSFVHELAGLPVPPVKDLEAAMAEEQAAEEKAKADALKALQTSTNQNGKTLPEHAQPAPVGADIMQASELPRVFLRDANGTWTDAEKAAVKDAQTAFVNIVAASFDGLLDAEVEIPDSAA